ncbi:hypothetical protein GCM10009706_34220 [Curtobacterium citreum]|uniref:Uncharacterized protein n=1 Tax=Curtobacterium citreum TaxID=2036 RepID=A0ABT2HLY5_9MICO|nr:MULTISPECIES: hypothetical protein [Curtobacterium]MCS6524285.1 hypothetical protein [Curtobacterium citreum]RDI00974.1 hypothetical protein DEU32_1022 [Curtobacterium sp. AG1037]TQJ26349.1 hypothetical protein FB462_0179 [Curtobacterium citreum]GGL92895.1 hypothetical protein GCM10009706_34220 [Curtobacterium citreum]
MPEWNGLQIPVTDLRLVFDRILQHVEHANGESVVLREDYFYSLPAPGLYDVSSNPPEATIGQLTESWDNLTSAPAADRTLNWELVWLGDVLRAIGHLLPEGEQRSADR